MTFRPWTPEEDARMQSLRREGRTWEQIGRILRRPYRACANRWYRLRTGGAGARRSSPPWTPEEDAMLRGCCAGSGRLEDLAEELGRTPRAVRARAQVLGLVAVRVPKRIQEAGGLRRCHDCGAPTPDYRCPACRRLWQIKNHVPLDVAAKNAEAGDEEDA